MHKVCLNVSNAGACYEWLTLLSETKVVELELSGEINAWVAPIDGFKHLKKLVLRNGAQAWQTIFHSLKTIESVSWIGDVPEKVETSASAITLDVSSVGPEILKGISSCKSLTLDVCSVDFGDVEFKNLQDLCIVCSTLKMKDLKTILTRMPALKSLKLPLGPTFYF